MSFTQRNSRSASRPCASALPTLRALSVRCPSSFVLMPAVYLALCSFAQVHRHSRIPKIPERNPDLQDEHDPFSKQGPPVVHVPIFSHSSNIGLTTVYSSFAGKRFRQQVITAMAQQFTIEAFQESELLVNITQHVLVPRHEVLSPEDKKTLLTR